MRVTEAAAEFPTELLAVILYAVLAIVTVGIPEITQVLVLSVSPAGRVGEAVQLVMVAPLLLSVVGVTLILLPRVPTVPDAPAKLKLGTFTPVESVTSAAIDEPEILPAVTL